MLQRGLRPFAHGRFDSSVAPELPFEKIADQSALRHPHTMVEAGSASPATQIGKAERPSGGGKREASTTYAALVPLKFWAGTR